MEMEVKLTIDVGLLGMDRNHSHGSIVDLISKGSEDRAGMPQRVRCRETRARVGMSGG